MMFYESYKIHHPYLLWDCCTNGHDVDLFRSIVWGFVVSGPTGPQVYEDDLDRNYNLILEVLIALRASLDRGDGLPTVKDLQACFFYGVSTWH